MLNKKIFIAKTSELSQSGAKGISLDGLNDQLFLVMTKTEVVLWVNDCPHNHRPLEYQKDKFLSADGKHIVCYAHSAHFDKVSGECFAGPCKGKKLRKIQHHEINGQIYVESESLINLKE
ncbi:Rieske (2Fe-2S) protein [Acinetobacter lactucae]|uniref:Rieske (2Fe-2S) protein n=1 Tax=Acinetobacter lactucae TaxID=1785128 RepID=UPI0007074956|nr:Rieske 2Fe-2S domain-containing protein [Acinetobacter lactucae]KQE92703.1 ferredoxin [Acinetobacter lactucae]